MVDLFRGKVVDVAPTSLIVELAGTEEKIEAFVELMKPYGIKELARTGVIAMARGMQPAKAAGRCFHRRQATAQPGRPGRGGSAAELESSRDCRARDDPSHAI